jgi:hypothetical protein
MLQVLQGLFNGYDRVQIKNQSRFFPPNRLKEFVDRFRLNNGFNVSVVGESEFGNEVFKVSVGNGPIKIMAWSQMHGNEATGTLALLELLELMTSAKLEDVWSELTFVCMFMVNPDGASKFTRRNGYNVDINRDAQAKKALETRLLVEQINLEKPDVALNLHDQRNIFGVTGFGNPATISFLAPSYNREREINDCRKKCMQLIAGISEGLSRQIGNSIGKYSDEYYPSAFGEYVQSLGIPCVLIESGAALNDPNRELARKMNVYCVFKLFSDLIDNSWKKRSIRDYQAIPDNNTDFFDVIIKNVKLKFQNRVESMDLGILVKQELDSGVLKDYYQITDIGDLSFKHGLEVLDAYKEQKVHEGFELNSCLALELSSINESFTMGLRN